MLWPAQLGLELEDIQRVRQTLTRVVSQMTIPRPAETEALVSMKLPPKTIVFVLAICKDRPATEQIGHMRQLKLDLIKNGEKRKRNQKFETTVECKCKKTAKSNDKQLLMTCFLFHSKTCLRNHCKVESWILDKINFLVARNRIAHEGHCLLRNHQKHVLSGLGKDLVAVVASMLLSPTSQWTSFHAHCLIFKPLLFRILRKSVPSRKWTRLWKQEVWKWRRRRRATRTRPNPTTLPYPLHQHQHTFFVRDDVSARIALVFVRSKWTKWNQPDLHVLLHTVLLLYYHWQ